MFALTFFGDICIGVAAYAAGAYTWPWLHQKFVGAEAYALKLSDKAAEIKSDIKGS